MSRNAVEITPIRAERIMTVCKLENLTQAKLAEDIGMTPQGLNRIIKLRQSVTDLTIERIHEKYPKYRKQWLKGDDDYMTNADLFMNTIRTADEEAQRLHTGFFSFAQLSGYQISVADVYGGQDAKQALSAIKEYCTITKDGKSLTLSISDLNSFENELCDYVDLRLKYMLK